MMGFYWVSGLILYHRAGCDGLLAMCDCLSVCLCVLAITVPRRSNAKIQPQWNVWSTAASRPGWYKINPETQYTYIFIVYLLQLWHLHVYQLFCRLCSPKSAQKLPFLHLNVSNATIHPVHAAAMFNRMRGLKDKWLRNYLNRDVT